MLKHFCCLIRSESAERAAEIKAMPYGAYCAMMDELVEEAEAGGKDDTSRWERWLFRGTVVSGNEGAAAPNAVSKWSKWQNPGFVAQFNAEEAKTKTEEVKTKMEKMRQDRREQSAPVEVVGTAAARPKFRPPLGRGTSTAATSTAADKPASNTASAVANANNNSKSINSGGRNKAAGAKVTVNPSAVSALCVSSRAGVAELSSGPSDARWPELPAKTPPPSPSPQKTP